MSSTVFQRLAPERGLDPRHVALADPVDELGWNPHS
jgi:hypothetical protein